MQAKPTENSQDHTKKKWGRPKVKPDNFAVAFLNKI